MEALELKDPKILGEEHPTYGFSFWSETDGDYPVMFNSKEGNIMPGTRVTYDTAELKISSKGNQYLRLKKVKFEDSPGQTQVPFMPKTKPTFVKAQEAEDKRGDGITASMAFKLAYHGFIQTEQIQPRADEHWAFVKEQGRQIFWGIKDVMNSQPDGGSVDAGPTPSSPIKEEGTPLDQPATLGSQFRNRKPLEDNLTADEPDLTDEDMRQ